MSFRWWNSFNVLAVVLLAIGIAGAVLGSKMVFDPGRASSGREWIIYVVAGGLMLLNGFLPPSNPASEEDDSSDRSRRAADEKRSVGSRKAAEARRDP